jgi:RNA recognition motif-containing protein
MSEALTKIIVNYLPKDMNSAEFELLISGYKDSISHSNVVFDHRTHQCIGYGFVYFNDKEAALKFIKEFDGKPVRGKRLFRISFL